MTRKKPRINHAKAKKAATIIGYSAAAIGALLLLATGVGAIAGAAGLMGATSGLAGALAGASAVAGSGAAAVAGGAAAATSITASSININYAKTPEERAMLGLDIAVNVATLGTLASAASAARISQTAVKAGTVAKSATTVSRLQMATRAFAFIDAASTASLGGVQMATGIKNKDAGMIAGGAIAGTLGFVGAASTARDAFRTYRGIQNIDINVPRSRSQPQAPRESLSDLRYENEMIFGNQGAVAKKANNRMEIIDPHSSFREYKNISRFDEVDGAYIPIQKSTRDSLYDNVRSSISETPILNRRSSTFADSASSYGDFDINTGMYRPPYSSVSNFLIKGTSIIGIDLRSAVISVAGASISMAGANKKK